MKWRHHDVIWPNMTICKILKYIPGIGDNPFSVLILLLLFMIFLSTVMLLLFILSLLLGGLLSQSLDSSFIEARSTTSWSALQNSPSSRRANSSPGISCLLHATHRKQSMWYEFSRAFITKSFLEKPWSHFEHFCPNNLKKRQIENI